VEDPTGATTVLGYGDGYLLTSLVEPSGAAHRFDYDTGGALVRDTGPDGGTTTLQRSRPGAGEWAVTVTDPAGRPTVYGTRRLPDGSIERTVTDPAGATTAQTDGPDGRLTITQADGTTIRVTRKPDPRFGLAAAYIGELTVTPSGATAPTQVRQESRAVTLASSVDPLSLAGAETVVTTNGKSVRTTYTDSAGSGGTLTRTTAAGRPTSLGLDEQGRVVRVQQGDLAPLTRGFDGAGRLVSEDRGEEQRRYSYDTLGNLTSRADGTGAATSFAYDGAGRVTRTSRPSSLSTDYGYDADGRLVQVDASALGYRGDDQLVSFTSADGDAYAFSADAAGARTSTRLPSGATVSLDHNDDGRLSIVTQRDPGGSEVAQTLLSYQGSSGRFTSVQRQSGGSVVQALTNAFTGSRLTQAAWSGAAEGTFDYGYDVAGATTSRTLTSGADSVARAFGYDDDGLLVRSGPFTLTRDPSTGEVTRIADGAATTDLAFDDLGRPSARTTSISGTTVHSEQVTRDAAHRVTSRSTTSDGPAATRTYTYDVDGRLTEVSENGLLVEAYTWDDAGRRIARTDTRGTAAASYDADGRLVTEGGTVYSYTPDGNLAARGSDSFRWSPRGELLQATVSGQIASYQYDGFGRRVSRSVGGATTQYLYGNLTDVTQLTASRSADGLLTVYDYDEEQRLVGFERGGQRFYVATDALGSPAVVTDAFGTVVKALSYSAFGVVTSDSAPGFELPVGFASGLTDPVTGLVHFAARDYDPATGLWTARDPGLFDGGQVDLYLYALGDPVNRVDRTGLASVEVGAGLGLYLGIKLGLTSEGFSFCWEGGLGIGAGVSIDPLEGLDTNGSSTFQAEIGGDVAGFGMGAKLSRRISKGPCGRSGEIQAEAKACAGIVCGKVNNDGLGGGVDLGEVAGLELQAKATLNTCVASNW
jgi:RHS repeat-associated protein